MRKFFHTCYEMRQYLLLWATQALSALGSGMTSYALVVWSYTQEGSALATALLMVSSYAPYVLLSVFAGALSDRWDKRRTMLVCDVLAALTTVITLALMRSGALRMGHLYLLNALNGLMNTVQQPASEVATTALLPKAHYQRVGALRYLADALNGVLKPILATALLGLAGMEAVMLFDLATFAAAFLTLALFIRVPRELSARPSPEPLMRSVRQGLGWLRAHRGILHLMLFLAAINLVASMYNAAFPAMVLSRGPGGEKALGAVNAVIGLAMLLGSLAASALPVPRSRVRVICNALLFSMSTENIILALGRAPWQWALGGFLGWIAIPLMNANLDALMRLEIPVEIQGRVFACRNALQFFTIPLGYFLGGALVDGLFEPLMAGQAADSPLSLLFGQGKGSGAAMFFSVLALLGFWVCLAFRGDRHIWALEQKE